METPVSTLSFPRLNEPAPAFEAPTTAGLKKLSDYAGKWLVLFSHPADCTLVYTTEFIEFSKRHAAFQEMNTQLLGISIDNHYSHITWIRNIKEKFGVGIPFPIIAELKIDPQGIIGTMVYFPMSNGRSIDEIFRLVTADF